MSTITVHRPDAGEPHVPAVRLARRQATPSGARLLVVDNGKPGARALLERMADRLRARLPLGEVEVHTKASAGEALGADEVRLLAARSHLVLTGIGD